ERGGERGGRKRASEEREGEIGGERWGKTGRERGSEEREGERRGERWGKTGRERGREVREGERGEREREGQRVGQREEEISINILWLRSSDWMTWRDMKLQKKKHTHTQDGHVKRNREPFQL